MAVKVYELLPSMDSDAPVYQTLPNNQREQIRKIPRHRPYLQVTFQDENGVSKTIRYKSGSNHIFLKEQMELDKIDANAKFTQNERDNLWFKFGVLATDKKNLQDFLENHPEFEGFKGSCDDVKKPCYRLVNKAVDSKSRNAEQKKRVQAASKIYNLDLDEARAMLIKINGAYFDTPNTGDAEADLAECQNMLTDFLDDTNEAGLDAILKEKSTDTVDEKVTILIGKLINAGELSFDAQENAIVKKGKDGAWIKLRDISSTQYTPEERMRLFSDFLNTEDGKILKNDLEKQLTEFESKTNNKEKKYPKT